MEEDLEVSKVVERQVEIFVTEEERRVDIEITEERFEKPTVVTTLLEGVVSGWFPLLGSI